MIRGRIRVPVEPRQGQEQVTSHVCAGVTNYPTNLRINLMIYVDGRECPFQSFLGGVPKHFSTTTKPCCCPVLGCGMRLDMNLKALTLINRPRISATGC